MFVDIHHHLIHGVDDGPQSFEHTQRMLLHAAEQGVSQIVATSHATPGREAFPAERYLRHLAQAQEWCDAQGLNLCIHSGCEVLYTDESPRLLSEGQVPTLAQTWAVLVEFFPGDPFERLCQAARALGNEGFTVVMAHVERYRALQSLKHVEELREEYDVKMQMNCNTLLTRKGFLMDRWTRKMIENGYIDYVASDAHNTSSRPCSMQACYEELFAKYGEETANALCFENQIKLLQL